MIKQTYILIWLLILSNLVIAQDANHLNFWGRISLTQPINKQIKLETEFQHRTQNDYTQKKNNIFEEQLLNSVRTWLHYQHKTDIGFSISPFAYYWNSPIIILEADKSKPQSEEVRFSVAFDLKHEVAKNLWMIDRTCFEYRDFQHTNSDIVRARNRFGLRYELNNKWNITSFDEIFLNINGVKPNNFFDQNRIALLFNYKPTKDIRIETGYLYISRLPKNAEEFLYEDNLILHLYYTFNQLKKQKA